MTPIDNGGIEVFAGEEGDAALPMGIAPYKRPADGAVFAIVSRKTGPSGSYLWQYRLSDDGTGYILVSDQQGNAFRIFSREGAPGNPHDHRLLKAVQVGTNGSDGSEVTNAALGERFPSGLFVAMSDNRTFQLYSWDDIAGDDLVKAPNGVRPVP